MSMMGYYRRVTSEELSQLIAGSSVFDFLYRDSGQEPDASRELNIDKTWHAIHFLLNDSDWGGEDPLFSVVIGGAELGTEDTGYGPAHYLVPEEVKAVATAINEIPAWELVEKYDAERMNEEHIYPEGWEDRPIEREYISEHYAALVSFFRAAADADDAMIVYLA